MAEDETFETQDAGAADSYPIEAGQIRKGGHIMIKGRPCKVTDVSSSKTGKHGHAKCHFVANDIFTGKKCEDLVPASHTTYAPFVKKVEYQCMDVDDDGFLSVMDSDGNTRDDLKIPDAMPMPPPDADVLSKRIRDLLAEEKDFYIVVLMACGIEQVIDTKVMTNQIPSWQSLDARAMDAQHIYEALAAQVALWRESWVVHRTRRYVRLRFASG